MPRVGKSDRDLLKKVRSSLNEGFVSRFNDGLSSGDSLWDVKHPLRLISRAGSIMVKEQTPFCLEIRREWHQ
jgi:hypothetical protein